MSGHDHHAHDQGEHDHGGHDHGGHAGHHHAPASFGRAFLCGIFLNSAFIAVEVVYGLAAGSMALLADAGHNLSDVLGLGVAWAGAAAVRRAPSPRFSYGLKKSSILAALFNAILLLVAVGAIIAEAVRRLLHPAVADGTTVMVVAGIGIAINAITAWLFARGREGDLNIRGAYVHMMADAGVSAAVVAAGLAIRMTGATWIDPAASLMVSAVILWSSWGLLSEAVTLSLAGVPRGIEVDQVGRALAKLPGVAGMHHLHIWPLSTTETAMTVHLLVEPGVDHDVVLGQANAYVHKMFGIAHATIQVERACAEHQ